jgi:hypothetical protein
MAKRQPWVGSDRWYEAVASVDVGSLRAVIHDLEGNLNGVVHRAIKIEKVPPVYQDLLHGPEFVEEGNARTLANQERFDWLVISVLNKSKMDWWAWDCIDSVEISLVEVCGMVWFIVWYYVASKWD